MARTRTQLRQLTAQRLSGGEIRWPITGTADAGGTTTILRDSPLSVYVNDKLIGAHIFLTSGSPTFTELEVLDSAQTNGDLTFRPTLGAAPDTLTYEVLPFSATDIHRALDDAMQILFTEGRLVRQFWMWMVAGSPIWNADWSFWDSATVEELADIAEQLRLRPSESKGRKARDLITSYREWYDTLEKAKRAVSTFGHGRSIIRG